MCIELYQIRKHLIYSAIWSQNSDQSTGKTRPGCTRQCVCTVSACDDITPCRCVCVCVRAKEKTRKTGSTESGRVTGVSWPLLMAVLWLYLIMLLDKECNCTPIRAVTWAVTRGVLRPLTTQMGWRGWGKLPQYEGKLLWQLDTSNLAPKFSSLKRRLAQWTGADAKIKPRIWAP